MTNQNKVAVVGLGEIGKPLFNLLSEKYETVGVDISTVGPIKGVDVLHVCYPFQIPDFIGETARYIDLFRPALTMIESTVAVGTTRKIAARTGAAVVNSPVRGKHAQMLEELRMYTKFVGADDAAAGAHAVRHFEALGVKTRLLSSSEATELAKLCETTYFGVLIAWAQEVERYCDQTGQNYDEVVAIFEEIKYLPAVKFFPGTIGGHCVLPNIEILRDRFDSALLEAILTSNDQKVESETRASQVAIGA